MNVETPLFIDSLLNDIGTMIHQWYWCVKHTPISSLFHTLKFLQRVWFTSLSISA